MIKKEYAEIKRVPDTEDLLQQAVRMRVLLFTALENLEYEESKREGLALTYTACDVLEEIIVGLRARDEWDSRENHIQAIAGILETPKDRRKEWDAHTLQQKGIKEDGRTAKEVMSEYADKVRRREIVITY